MISVAFTGDIAFSKHFAEAYKRDFIDGEVAEFLKSADHVVANVEAPITAGAIQSDRALNHTMPPQVVDTLLSIGAKNWTLANNHVMDAKEQGIRDTLAAAAANGCRTLGAGMNLDEARKPLYLEGAGGIGIFSVTYDRDFLKATDTAAGCVLIGDTETIRENIREIKKTCRWCVVIGHAGGEFSQLPLPYVRRRYREFLDMGADVVIGHHPHVVQNYEKVGDKVIFYSLGNFIFDTNYQRNQRYTEYGMLVKLQFEETAFTWENCPVLIDRTTQRITRGENPAVFCNVSGGDYTLLWPLMMRDYFINDHAARLFTKPDWKDKGFKDWFTKYRKRHGLWPTLEIYLGNALYYLGLWNLSSRKELKAYMKPVKR